MVRCSAPTERPTGTEAGHAPPPSRVPRHPKRRTRRGVPGHLGRRGFTLLETALSTIIIGVGVLAVIEAQRAFLEKNLWSTNASTATFLANEIRERTRLFPRHDRFAGGLYFTNPGDPTSLRGWGPETGEGSPADFNDLDDFDGAVFGTAPNLPEGFTLRARYTGPIDAVGDVIPETLWDGTTQIIDGDEDEEATIAPLRGWTQCVQVRKVNPADVTAAVANSAQVTVNGNVVRRVEQYPLRVTVIVMYQQQGDATATEVARVSWVAPP